MTSQDHNPDDVGAVIDRPGGRRPSHVLDGVPPDIEVAPEPLVGLGDQKVRKVLRRAIEMAMGGEGLLSWRVTIDKASSSCGVSNKTIYERVGNKEAFPRAVYEYAWWEMIEAAKEVSVPLPRDGADHLRKVFGRLVREIDGELAAVVEFLLTVERRNLGDLYGPPPSDERRFWVHLVSLAEQGMADGSVARRDPRLLVEHLWLDLATVYIGHAFRRDHTGQPQAQSAAAALSDLISKTLAADGEGAAGGGGIGVGVPSGPQAGAGSGRR